MIKKIIIIIITNQIKKIFFLQFHCNCSWKMCDLVLNDLHRVQGDNQRDSASLKNHLNVLDFCFFPEFHVSALKAAKPCFQRTLCVCVCVSELRVFVVVCVTFQKVSEVCELRLTEEECEDFCCHVKAAVVY